MNVFGFAIFFLKDFKSYLLENMNQNLLDYASAQGMDRIEAAQELLEGGLKDSGFGLEDE